MGTDGEQVVTTIFLFLRPPYPRQMETTKQRGGGCLSETQLTRLP